MRIRNPLTFLVHYLLARFYRAQEFFAFTCVREEIFPLLARLLDIVSHLLPVRSIFLRAYTFNPLPYQVRICQQKIIHPSPSLTLRVKEHGLSLHSFLVDKAPCPV